MYKKFLIIFTIIICISMHINAETYYYSNMYFGEWIATETVGKSMIDIKNLFPENVKTQLFLDDTGMWCLRWISNNPITQYEYIEYYFKADSGFSTCIYTELGFKNKYDRLIYFNSVFGKKIIDTPRNLNFYKTSHPNISLNERFYTKTNEIILKNDNSCIRIY